MRDRPEQQGSCSGPEGGPLCAEPVAHEILEGINLKKLHHKDSKKNQHREEYSVIQVVGVRIQVYKKGWKSQRKGPFESFEGIYGTLRLGLG